MKQESCAPLTATSNTPFNLPPYRDQIGVAGHGRVVSIGGGLGRLK